jgi:hypothetical protein
LYRVNEREALAAHIKWRGKMPEYSIRCRVTLEGATMYITADSPSEAKRKAQAHEFDNIEYDQAELVDWDLTGTIIEEAK